MKNSLARVLTPVIETIDAVNQVVNSCADAKAMDVTVLDMNRVAEITEYLVVASGRSDRQVQGIANRILEQLEQIGLTPLSVEGLDRAHWVVLDYGDFVVHVFYEGAREHYDIEGLWMKADRLPVIRDSQDGHLEVRAS